MNNILKTIALLLGFVSTLMAQYGSVGVSDPRTIAMGKTGAISSRGIDALGYNPANLMMSEDRHFEFTSFFPIPSLNFRAGSNFLNIEEYNYYFGGVQNELGETVGRALTATDMDNFRKLFEDGGVVLADFNINWVAFSYKMTDDLGAFGFKMNDVAYSKIKLPSDLFTIAIKGNEPGRLFTFNDADAKSWWIRNYSLTYSNEVGKYFSNPFEKIYVGLSVKYVQGFAYVGIKKVEGKLETGKMFYSIQGEYNSTGYSSLSPDFGVKYSFDSTNSKKANMNLFPTPAAVGMGADFGISAKLDSVWSFSLAATDIGALRWKKEVAEFHASGSAYIDDILDKDKLDSIKDNNFHSHEIYREKYSTPLATALRIGVAFQADKAWSGFPGKMILTFDYNQGLFQQPGNSAAPRFSFGFEWEPTSWLPYIRSGVSIWGEDIFVWGIGTGFGLGKLKIELATADMLALVNTNKAKGASFSLGTKWVFE